MAATDRRRRALECALLVVSAWIGEQTCISLYGFYAYADGWWGKIGDVPALVPLIWPMVILSARDVVAALWPSGASRGATALRVGVVVLIDASLMEVIAVAAGLWRWSEGGYYEVPLIGILGWGFFGVAASWWLDATAGARRAGVWLLPAVTVAATHAALVVAWWAALRWVLRGDLGDGAIYGFAALLVPVAVVALRARRTRRLPWATTVSRVVAASIFFALLVTLDGAVVPYLWAHTALVAVPYLLLVGGAGVRGVRGLASTSP